MKIVVGTPPNWDAILAKFSPMKSTEWKLRRAYYAYGDVIYMPTPRVEIDRGIVQHETVHSQQQKRHGGPDAWWERYIEDPDFRREQEIEAYRAQIAFYALKLPRKVMRQVVLEISKQLAGPLYGRMMTRQDAVEALTSKSWRPGPAALPPLAKLLRAAETRAEIATAVSDGLDALPPSRNPLRRLARLVGR